MKTITLHLDPGELGPEQAFRIYDLGLLEYIFEFRRTRYRYLLLPFLSVSMNPTHQ